MTTGTRTGHGTSSTTFGNGWCLQVEEDTVTLWDGRNFMRSRAAWHERKGHDAYYARKPWIAVTPEFPADLAGLIAGVLDGAPMDPLIDWLIEFGPAGLAAGLMACLDR